MISRLVARPLLAALFYALAAAPALAENYQTDIGPTPLDGTNRANIMGRGWVLATLEGSKFTIHGTFAGLSSAATDAHLCLGNVMGGTGPAIHDISVSQAASGEISGSLTLTPAEITALKTGKIYVLLNSQKAPKGNLWGWFQPAHVTVGPDVPQQGNWYLPNILNDDNGAKKDFQG